jgi:hypothetical protein
MSVWKDIMLDGIAELERINYTKINVIQQKIADIFQDEQLTRKEVFCILNGMIDQEMVNFEQAKKYFKRNHQAILDAENIELRYEETYNDEKCYLDNRWK